MADKIPVSFKHGLLANLPATKTSGTIYITTDERALYMDVNDETRIRLGDFQSFTNLAALQANTNPSTTALYYIEDINCLAKWDGSKYVQINRDTGATDVKTTGDGNAITGATYDAATRTITFTKGITFALPGDITQAINDLDLVNTYETKGAAAAAKSEVIGSSTDASSANTIYGAKKKAEEEASAVLGTASDTSASETVKGARLLANEKVASLSAGDNSVTIGGADAQHPTVAVKLAPGTDNAIELGENGLKVVIPAAAEYTITKQETAEDGYFATYQLFKGNVAVGDKINIARDYLVKSAEIKTVSEAGNPYDGAKAGDKYIDFVVNVKEGASDESHIYLPVNDLAHVYTAGQGIEIDSSDVVFVKIDSANANGLYTGNAGLKLSPATDDNAGAMTAADHKKLHTHANKTELDLFEAGDKSKLDTAASKAAANEAAISNIKDGEDIDSFGDVETALATAKNEVVGNAASDTVDSKTIEGTRKYAEHLVSDAAINWGTF